jgi:hypothetical protein
MPASHSNYFVDDEHHGDSLVGTAPSCSSGMRQSGPKPPGQAWANVEQRAGSRQSNQESNQQSNSQARSRQSADRS